MLTSPGFFFQEANLLERSSDLSNSGEFKRQTASEIAILRNNSDTQSVSSWVYKETEIKI